MQKWRLKPGDPLNLVLAADSRFCQPDYANDQIWEIIPNGGEQASFLLESTLGLRCRWVRLFPKFIYQDKTLCNPNEFHQPPALTAFYPNLLTFSFSLFEGLDGRLEYRVIDSQTMAGKVYLASHSLPAQPMKMEWGAMLKPLPGGRAFLPLEPGSLCGQSGGLAPAFFFSDNPEPGAGSLPTLVYTFELQPNRETAFTWGFSARADTTSSLASARQAASGLWEAETARIELANTGQEIAITTGKPDWDAALSLAQKTALGLVLPGSGHLPHPTFILNRLPDQGFSSRGDGSDYSHLWNGQTPQDLYALASLLLPGDAGRVRGMLQNFIDLQEADGFIDMKPGLAGQRIRRLAPPLLATLALNIFQYKPDVEWLSAIFPPLLKFFNLWFDPAHDRDADGFPEWDHAVQAGLEDVPLFDHWHGQSQGVNAAVLESPSLAAFLYREAKSLIRMAKLSGHPQAINALSRTMDTLKKGLAKSWDAERGIFHYRDFQNHRSQKGFVWISFKGSGKFRSRRSLRISQRLRIQIRCKEQTTCPLSILLEGEDENGEVIEQISSGQFTWANGTARVTTKHLFRRIKKAEIQGLKEEDEGQILACDLTKEDASLFLPLWAGMLSRNRAAEMVNKALLKNYLQPYGVPLVPAQEAEPPDGFPLHTHLLWNIFLIEGLHDYGFHKEAAGLTGRLMDAAVLSLQQTRAFCEYSDAQSGRPGGERGHLRGILPVGIFLKVLGVQFLSEREVKISGANPFPWPITVKYRGTSVTRHQKDSVITFINGQTTTVSGPGNYRVTLEENATRERRI